jgi:intersectin
LADSDKDGRLTSDEFVVAMHCCDVARAGHALPSRVPDDWSNVQSAHREQTESVNKPLTSPLFMQLNQELRDVLTSSSTNTTDNENKNDRITYEDKRKKNYEVSR